MMRVLVNGLQRTLLVALALTPWLLSMYTFYWLDASGTWTRDTPHRGKLSVVLLAFGMVLSFLLSGYLARRHRR
ncbi:MAG: hypothetical protein AAFN78_12200 [Pseudomonadota bacterium]